MKTDQPYRLIISGGGTGGHVFPAVAIANTFRERYPDAEIVFVGAHDRMEMTCVPEAGYKIIGLWISGIQRSLSLSNLLLPVKLITSYFKAKDILKKIKPHAVIGTGGYASGPVMLAATRLGIPSLIQEQNSFAGLANKQVADKVNRICVAYEGMEKYFPKEKIVLTGNPVRKDILSVKEKRGKALSHFGFDASVKTLLVIGGSLGSKTINESVYNGFDKILDAGIQLLWQTGKGYYAHYSSELKKFDLRKIRLYDFVKEMDLAYAAADAVISRSGALAISELCVAGKPSILVPSPNVAEDHQTKNAEALASRGAAILIPDKEAGRMLINEAIKLLYDEHKAERLTANISKLAKPNAANDIVDQVEKIMGVRANGIAITGVNNRAMMIN